MKWSLQGWEQDIERLVNQCADKVMVEMEEAIMLRLREAGQSIVQGLFSDQAALRLESEGQTLSEGKKDFLEEVLYAFGIINVSEENDVNMLGMEDRPCRIVQVEHLGMLVCPVPLRDYNEESLHQHLEDMAWVESHARRHEEVLLGAMEDRAVIPLPFCTIFTNEDNIKEQLVRNAKEIQVNLHSLVDRKEMQVKLFVQHKRLLEKLQADFPYSGGQSGGGYFQKRQWEKKIAEEMERVMDEYGENLYQDLNNISEVILLDKAGVLAPEGHKVVFAVQCLIHKDFYDEWDKLLAKFDQITDSLGFILEVSGPWPPYHFSRLTYEEETTGG